MTQINCTKCPRLAAYIASIKAIHPDYFCAPVPPFGDQDPELLVVGLAPGRGTNRTGRPFTGDVAGELLYPMLVKYGWATGHFEAKKDDTIVLHQCRITNAVKCVPPENKPIGSEITACRALLKEELAQMPSLKAILCLGTIAHHSVIRSYGLNPKDYPFKHHAQYILPDGRLLVSSYHCSKYNTSTRRLTPQMFEDVFKTLAAFLKQHPCNQQKENLTS